MNNKRIVIIGGMGPQASLHAHGQLLSKMTAEGKRADIVHVSLHVPHFFASKPELMLTDSQKEILRSLDADMGFIACNTAHHFFHEFQKLVKFNLEHLVDEVELPDDSVVFCSPTARELKIFGNVTYASATDSQRIGRIIKSVNDGKSHEPLSDITSRYDNKTLVFGCTELSMLAHEEGLGGIDTLELTIDKIASRL